MPSSSMSTGHAQDNSAIAATIAIIITSGIIIKCCHTSRRVVCSPVVCLIIAISGGLRRTRLLSTSPTSAVPLSVSEVKGPRDLGREVDSRRDRRAQARLRTARARAHSSRRIPYEVAYTEQHLRMARRCGWAARLLPGHRLQEARVSGLPAEVLI